MVSLSTGVWFNSTSNGGVWNGYVNTNIQGGDPSALKLSDSNYLMIFVGNPYSTGINDVEFKNESIVIYPNPVNRQINVKAVAKLFGSDYTVYDNTGKSVLSGKINSEKTVIDLGDISGGIYFFNVGSNLKQTFKVIKE